MCGRFAFFSPAEAIQAAFGTDLEFRFDPRYNIAPSQAVTVLRTDEGGALVVEQMRWGLVPFWAKDPAIGNRMINARAETIAEKPSYRQPFSRRRCLILADGFYEWRKEQASKTPFFICRTDRQPFGLAGIWDEWDKGASSLRSCSIITVPANKFMSDLHHRMPVIMERDTQGEWFDPQAVNPELLEFLLGPQAVDLQAWAVAKKVNSPANDYAELLVPAG
jgi:putative SOS response-associated peptidase YedK